MKILSNDMYLLLIDEEAEILQMDYYLDDDNYTIAKATLPPDQYEGCVKIIAYRKLNEEAKELDLPELPNPFESNYKHPLYALLSAIDILKSDGFDERCDALVHLKETEDFIKDLKQLPKQFSLEDVESILIKYLEEGFISKEQGHINPKTFLQSLSTQQLPKEFIPEYEEYAMGFYGMSNGEPTIDTRLKTITNSEGREILVGTYKY